MKLFFCAAGMYYCFICGESFEEGEVFHLEQAGRWYEARKYAAYHVQQTHGSMLDCLLGLDKKATGLTDLQKELIRGFADNLSDGEMNQQESKVERKDGHKIEKVNIEGHTNKDLQKEWKEYGSENFTFLILETVKFDQQVRYDYKDVFAAEGRQPIDMVRQYNREVAALKEQWLEKLQPYGEKGYHRRDDEVKE